MKANKEYELNVFGFRKHPDKFQIFLLGMMVGAAACGLLQLIVYGRIY